MKITSNMKIETVLAIDEEKMLRTLSWLAPGLGRLQYPSPLRAVLGSVSVQQAARIAQVPLTEMLYVLNLAAGESEEHLSEELCAADPATVGRYEANPKRNKGSAIVSLKRPQE